VAKVNEVNMAKWIVALRSGKYKQTRGKLRARAGGAMCCLGVACDVSGLGHWEAAQEGEKRAYVVGTDDNADTLPRPVAEWLMGDPLENNPTINVEHDPDGYLCSSVNDDEDWKFKKIADGLERTYLPGKKAEEILAGAV
jgi:hypothetical protein